MENGELRKTEQLCRSSINAAITKLCEVGTWPRPPAARRLRAGSDFYCKDLQGIQEANDLLEHLATDDKIKSIYFAHSSEPEPYILLYDYWERLLVEILYETEGYHLRAVFSRNGSEDFLRSFTQIRPYGGQLTR